MSPLIKKIKKVENLKKVDLQKLQRNVSNVTLNVKFTWTVIAHVNKGNKTAKQNSSLYFSLL